MFILYVWPPYYSPFNGNMSTNQSLRIINSIAGSNNPYNSILYGNSYGYGGSGGYSGYGGLGYGGYGGLGFGSYYNNYNPYGLAYSGLFNQRNYSSLPYYNTPLVTQRYNFDPNPGVQIQDSVPLFDQYNFNFDPGVQIQDSVPLFDQYGFGNSNRSSNQHEFYFTEVIRANIDLTNAITSFCNLMTERNVDVDTVLAADKIIEELIQKIEQRMGSASTALTSA